MIQAVIREEDKTLTLSNYHFNDVQRCNFVAKS